MIIIPSIDLYDNACVRLNQGKFNQLTSYSPDPLQCALDFAKQGATTLHIVDLNGAREGRPAHLELITHINNNTSLMIQSGGGLRDRQTIVSNLAAGIDRVVLGSIAVTHPDIVKSLIDDYGVQRFVLAFDVNINTVPEIAVNGWVEKTSTSLWNLLAHYESYSDLCVLCTDIGRDGMLSGPNIELYDEGVRRFPQFHWQASGGVAALGDISLLKNTGVSSVIVGKALYENRFTLAEALEALISC